MLEELKNFLFRGNIVELAVAFVMGVAFAAVVNSFVSDLVMPRMGGHDLLRTLKDQLSDITFILLTAQGTIESAVEAIKDGAYDYLSKPVDPQRLKILLQ